MNQTQTRKGMIIKMSYTRQYIATMDFQGHSYTAIVSSGNSLGAIHKFLIHIGQMDEEELNHKPDLTGVDTHFAKVTTLTDGTKIYSNTPNTVVMFITKMNNGSDFTFVNHY